MLSHPRWQKTALLLTLASLLIALTACKPSSTFTLRLHPQEGAAYVIKTTTTQHLTQEFMGQPMTLDQTMAFDYTWQITQVSDNGNFTIQVTYDRVAISQDQGGQKIAYDSAQGEEPPSFFKGFDLLVGKSFSIEMTPQGKIESVTGLNDMLRSVAEDAGMSDAKTEAFYEGLKDAFGEEAMADLFNATLASYPDDALKVGSTWETDTTYHLVFPLQAHTTYTVQSWEGNQAILQAQTTLQTDASQRTDDTNGMFDVVYALNGTQDTTLTVDLKSGFPLESHATQHVEGKILLLEPGSQDNDAALKVPVTMDTETSITIAPKP